MLAGRAARPVHLREPARRLRRRRGFVICRRPLVEAVRGHLAATAAIEAGLAEISAINTELLARRELD